MCGISGFCDFGHHSNETILRNMTDSMTHRGPDDRGYEVWSQNDYQIGFGQRRLSILDLSPLGHQPMAFQNLQIILNGEIYNYKEIREELKARGYQFISNSDTEVALKGFHCWGVKVVDKFIGMFAIVIFDQSAQQLYLIRDRAGVKPLYYYWDETTLLFASELKAFHQHPRFKKDIQQDGLAQFLRFGYIQSPYTIFENCYKVPQGNYLQMDLRSKKIAIHTYWDVNDYFHKSNHRSETEILEQLKPILQSALEYRMVSDVPVGVFLSGGYDSTLVTAMLQHNRTEKLKTFTIGFENSAYDEAPFAKEIAKHIGTDHSEYYCTEKEAKEIIPTLPYLFDEPFGDSSSIPTILVSRFAKKDVTVALSADGGDEVFAGYNAYDLALNYFGKIERIPKVIRNVSSTLLDTIPSSLIPFSKSIYNFETRYKKAPLLLKAKNYQEVMAVMYSTFTDQELKKLLKDHSFKYNTSLYDRKSDITDHINLMLANDYKAYMCDDILVKVDRAGMSVSLEGREPLLDHRIIEFVAGLPGNVKYKNRIKKYLLKKITHEYVPEELLNRPKKGFSIPIEEWFKGDLSFYIDEYLSKEKIEADGILDFEYVNDLIKDFRTSKKPNFQKLWFVLMFQMWKEQWL